MHARPRSRALAALKLAALIAVFSGAATLAHAPAAEAGVVEKIVAVVGDDAILLSELRQRAAPLIRVLASKAPAGPQRTAAESQVYKDVLSRMVEETLEAQAADRQKVTVTPDEIDRAIENVAGQQKAHRRSAARRRRAAQRAQRGRVPRRDPPPGARGQAAVGAGARPHSRHRGGPEERVHAGAA
jgi:peptidyl-prolyl cis-trans isomerase SurA